MIPGVISRLSETTVPFASVITAKSDVIVVSGTGTLDTITPQFGGKYDQMVTMIAIDGFSFSSAGNISAPTSAIDSLKAMTFFYSKDTKKWYAHL